MWSARSACAIAACSGDDDASPGDDASPRHPPRRRPPVVVTTESTSAADDGPVHQPTVPTSTSTAPTTTTTAPPSTTSSSSIPPTTAPPAPPDAAALAAIPLALQPFADVDMVTQMVVRPADDVAYASSQTGQIWRLADPAAPTLALDVSANVPPYEQGSERGLLGLGFGPSDGRMYVFFSDLQNNSHVVSYAMNADGTADANSAWSVIDVPSAGFGHKGGAMSFDGPTLYLALGDGGASKGRSAQDYTSLLGSIIRIVPHTDGPGYEVPTDNPFVGDPTKRPELWAKGLREPWGFWRDPVTGTLWISDVGDHTMEEIESDDRRSEGPQLRVVLPRGDRGLRRRRPGRPHAAAVRVPPRRDRTGRDRRPGVPRRGDPAVAGGLRVRGHGRHHVRASAPAIRSRS